MASDLRPLFIRLPRQQAAALDRLASKSGRPKQHVVSELVAQALAPTSTLQMGRVEVSARSLEHDDEVLTLEALAALLKLPADAVRTRAEQGDLPGRRFGDEWRFSRQAVLAWLAEGDAPHRKR